MKITSGYVFLPYHPAAIRWDGEEEYEAKKAADRERRWWRKLRWRKIDEDRRKREIW